MDAEKSGIRRRLHDRLRATEPEERTAWSAALRGHLLSSDRWREAGTVMLFAALRYEPDLIPLIEAAPEKRLVFPALENDLIVARAVHSPGDLEPAGHGIREPAPKRCPALPPQEIDLVLVPGLGFGRDGSRLGRGRGHYDRFLTTLPDTALLCGTAFQCQLSDALPAEGHDIPMHALLTENGWLPFC
ncbi:MAG TPA: 5-formyltetrahydrofolate cyclo-ligase [Verrucomicrobiales bacterium]|jgi:5-formyltetrahydrofolate cyclo-ligase|nr:5-formyltetrahydrofolate cyclo-ligase [Verrucomicrobiales bacterium]